MPTVTRISLDVRHDSFAASRILQARAENSSEAAALPNGERALTPIIAGTVSGTCVGTAWLIALIVIVVKRYRRQRRYRKVGQSANDELAAKRAEEERRRAEFILPPDPAVLEGGHVPGERIDVEQKRRWWKANARRAGVGGRRASLSGGYGPGSKNGKGKDRDLVERPTSPRTPLSAPERRRHSFSDQQRLRPPQPPVGTPDELLRPPYHPLSTIISVSDYQRFLALTPPVVEPPSPKSALGEVAQTEDVKDVDFAAPIFSDDKSLVEHESPQEHRYPPSCSH